MTKNKKNELNSMKASEQAIAERTAGMSIATLEDANYPKVGLLGALGWVVAKRDDPTLTYNAYMESKTLEEIIEDLGLDTEDDSE